MMCWDDNAGGPIETYHGRRIEVATRVDRDLFGYSIELEYRIEGLGTFSTLSGARQAVDDAINPVCGQPPLRLLP